MDQLDHNSLHDGSTVNLSTKARCLNICRSNSCAKNIDVFSSSASFDSLSVTASTPIIALSLVPDHTFLCVDHLHWIPLTSSFRPIFELGIDKPKYQIHHTPHELHQSRRHLSRSVPGGHATEIRVELHVVCKCRFGVRKMEESVDEPFFRQDLIDDLGKSGFKKLSR